MYKVVSIAGTDPSGGAGAQADLKTFMAHKVYGMSIITALVAQNTCGVRDILNVPTYFIEEQFDCVFEDIFPDAVKIGMVSEPEIITCIANKLKQYHAKHIVVDPVMVSTSGHCLLSDNALDTLKKELLPLAEIITPNIAEANILADMEIKDQESMILAAKKISQYYQGYILIKGGHFSNSANDLLYYQEKCIWLNAKRIDNPNTHGTGCTLSSAIASQLAKGKDVETSVKYAKKYITSALEAGLNLGKGSGPLDHCCDFQEELKNEI